MDENFKNKLANSRKKYRFQFNDKWPLQTNKPLT